MLLPYWALLPMLWQSLRLIQKLTGMDMEEDMDMEAIEVMDMEDIEVVMGDFIVGREKQKLLLMQMLPQKLIDMVTEEFIEVMVDMVMEDTEEVMEDIIEERGMQKPLLMQMLPQKLIDMVMEVIEAMEAMAMEDTEGVMVDTTVAKERQMRMLRDTDMDLAMVMEETGDTRNFTGVNSIFQPQFTT